MDEATPLIQITGKTRSGKSTLAKKLIAFRPRVVIIAPFPVGDKYGAEQFGSVREAYAAFKARPDIKTFRVAIVVQTPEEFREACWLVWTLAPCTLVPDETKLYLPSPAEAPMEFNYMAQAWAHAGDHLGEERAVSIIFVGQRPTNAPPIFRSEANVWYVFRTSSRADRKLLEDDMGLSRELAEKAGKLAPYHFMRVDNNGDVTYGKTEV